MNRKKFFDFSFGFLLVVSAFCFGLMVPGCGVILPNAPTTQPAVLPSAQTIANDEADLQLAYTIAILALPGDAAQINAADAQAQAAIVAYGNGTLTGTVLIDDLVQAIDNIAAIDPVAYKAALARLHPSVQTRLAKYVKN